MQNEEPQRPATARPSLLSAGSGAGETASILSELDGGSGKGAPPGPARRGRKGVVVATVLALAALGSTAALVMRDVNSVAQVAMATQGEAMPEAAADGGGHRVAVVADPAANASANAATAPAITSVPASATDSETKPDGAAVPAAAAGVAAPAVALAAALAAPSPDKPLAAATIVDAVPAHAEPAVIRPAVAKERKATPAKERHVRAAKAKDRAAADKGGNTQKTQKAHKAQKKPVQTRQVQQAKPSREPRQAKPDNDVELLAALVAHTRPPQTASSAPCQAANDKSSATACGAGQKR